MQGVEEARHYVEQAMNEDREQTNNIGNELDPEQEKEIEECQELEEIMHPQFVQVNPDHQFPESPSNPLPYITKSSTI
jgi:hypothetical protein